MRICALVCLAALAACTTSSLLLAQNHRPSESELRSEIEEHAIDPCLRAVLGNIGLRGKNERCPIQAVPEKHWKQGK